MLIIKKFVFSFSELFEFGNSITLVFAHPYF